MPTTVSWGDLDKNIKLTKDGDSYSLENLKNLFSDEDSNKIEIENIIECLNLGESGDFTCEIPIFKTVKMTPEILYKRIKDSINHNSITSFIYIHYTLAIKEGSKEEFPSEKKEKKTRKKSTTKKVTPKNIKLKNVTIADDQHKTFIPFKDENYYFQNWTGDFLRIFDSKQFHVVHLVGPSGCGKTSCVEQVCAYAKRSDGEEGVPMIRVEFDERTEPAQLLGEYRLLDGNTVWEDGPVTKAYREGIPLVLDEMDYLPPEFGPVLYSIMDGKPIFLKDVKGGERVDMHPNFRLVLTSNTKGKGDMTGQFAGTKLLNAAFRNRISATFECDYPSKSVYESILETNGLDKDDSKIIAGLATEMNKQYKEGVLAESLSLRQAVKIGQLAQEFEDDVKKAVELSVLNRMEIHESNAVKEILNRILA